MHPRRNYRSIAAAVAVDVKYVIDIVVVLCCIVVGVVLCCVVVGYRLITNDIARSETPANAKEDGPLPVLSTIYEICTYFAAAASSSLCRATISSRSLPARFITSWNSTSTPAMMPAYTKRIRL